MTTNHIQTAMTEATAAPAMHTPTPWTVLPVSNTFKIGTPQMRAFINRNHYLAGHPFVAEMNVDFSTDAEHDKAKVTRLYEHINDTGQAKANANFIIEACNAHSALLADNARLRERLEDLTQAACRVSHMGAQTGPQWTTLTVAILGAKSALTQGVTK